MDALGKPAGLEPQYIGVRKKRWVVCFENTILDLDLSIYEKMVYIVLCSHAKKDGSCFPSVKKIAEEASCSRTKVFESLLTLERLGIIVRNNQVFEGRGQTANLYEILDIDPGPQDERGDRKLPPPSVRGTGASVSRTGVSTARMGGVRGTDTHIDVLELNHLTIPKEHKIPPTPQRGKREKGDLENAKPETGSKGNNTKDSLLAILAAFNEILPELPPAESLTTSRCHVLTLRVSEDQARSEAEWWRHYFERVRLFPWLMGNNPKGWRATFDWLISENGMRKVLEGGFTQIQHSGYSPGELREWQRRYTDERGIVDAKALLRDWRAKTAKGR